MDKSLDGIKRGGSEIRPVYKRIINRPAEVYVEYYEYTIHIFPPSEFHLQFPLSPHEK